MRPSASQLCNMVSSSGPNCSPLANWMCQTGSAVGLNTPCENPGGRRKSSACNASSCVLAADPAVKCPDQLCSETSDSESAGCCVASNRDFSGTRDMPFDASAVGPTDEIWSTNSSGSIRDVVPLVKVAVD